MKIRKREKEKIIEFYKKGYSLDKILLKLEELGFANNTKNLLQSKIRSIVELRNDLNRNRITFNDIEKFKKELKDSKKK
ncbi:MAG: hypothetical protein GF329_22085 [Candidatus Lokiarchaeota archaeon]|nr:hypothetical protein [Candidatus Lokiarchaeota archaeon]